MQMPLLEQATGKEKKRKKSAEVINSAMARVEGQEYINVYYSILQSNEPTQTPNGLNNEKRISQNNIG